MATIKFHTLYPTEAQSIKVNCEIAKIDRGRSVKQGSLSIDLHLSAGYSVINICRLLEYN